MASFQKQDITSDCFRSDNSDATNASLFSQLFGREVTAVHVESMSGAGGFSGEMSRVRVTWADAKSGDGAEKVMVMKHTKENGAVSSKTLGLAREGCFYEWVTSTGNRTYDDLIPAVYYSKGNMETGDKVILLEDLGHMVQTGYFFGGGSPLNWGKDLESIVSSKGLSLKPTNSSSQTNVPLIVAEAACLLAAKYHGEHWLQSDLLDGNIWLKASDWFVGKGKESWQAQQAYIRDSWEKLKATKANVNNEACKWSAYIIGLIDASMSKISWEGFQDRIQNSHFTLAHGDFHPANMLCTFDNARVEDDSLSAEDVTIRLVDWEVVGVGSGAQDIGQYVISHMSPDFRREFGGKLLSVYYNTLRKYLDGRVEDGRHSTLGDYTFDICEREYVYGGVERWVFLLVLLANMVPDQMMQYFLNQVEAFALDHGITVDSIGMPRL